MSKGWANRSGAEYYKYQQQRKQMMLDNAANNGGKCTLAIPDVCTGAATQAHHVLGIEAGLLSPMVPACAACNRHIGQPSKGKDPAGRPPTW